MAEYCLKCWNKINGTNDPKNKYIFSKGLDLCEGCGKRKYVIITDRKSYYLHRFRFVFLPFKIFSLLINHAFKKLLKVFL